MNDCIFCKIVAKKIPAKIVYEDDKYLGFLDISPKTMGHTILITKEHFKWVYDVPNMGEYFDTANKIIKKMKEKLSPTYISLQTFGTEIPHAHIHIVPFYSMTEKYNRESPSEEKLEEILNKLNN